MLFKLLGLQHTCNHSFIPDISIAPLGVQYYSETLPTIEWSVGNVGVNKPQRNQKATVNEGLAQGPYVAAGVGKEHATLRTQGTQLACTTEPQSYNISFYRLLGQCVGYLSKRSIGYPVTKGQRSE